jgi:hypothetical protein
MKIHLAAFIILALPALMASGTDANRVRKYLADRGESNAVVNVNFTVRNDMDGNGPYVDGWGYPGIAKPTLAQCPSDEESDAWAGMMAQREKTVVMKVVENRFLGMCDELTGGTNHVKLGFAELQGIIELIPDTNAVVMVTLQLLSIDAQAKREGGLLWWDGCAWHPEAVPYMLAPPKRPYRRP